MQDLPSIPYLPLQFELEAQNNCQLSEIKGSMLRGAFGHALKSATCVNKHYKDCKQCLLKESCVFTQIFETFVTLPAPPHMKGVLTAPKPFILHSFSEQMNFKAGESLIFELTVFGNVCKFYPYVIYAVHKMAEKGLGVQRHPFTLKSVKVVAPNNESTAIYSGEHQKLTAPVTPFIPALRSTLPDSIKLHFITPTRLKQNGTHTMEFDFRWLVARMLHRIMELTYFYIDIDKAYWDFSYWMDTAKEVELLDPKFSWENWKRYSNRQQTKMKMGGFIGEVTLTGNVQPFSELLSLCEILHVGKGTSFGLGKIKIEEKND